MVPAHRLNPEAALIRKEGEELRVANTPPPIRERVTERLEQCVVDFGLEPTHKAASEWTRKNRPQLVKKTGGKSPKDAAEALFVVKEAAE